MFIAQKIVTYSFNQQGSRRYLLVAWVNIGRHGNRPLRDLTPYLYKFARRGDLTPYLYNCPYGDL